MHDIACDIIKTKINKVIQQGLNRIKPTKEQTHLTNTKSGANQSR